MKYLIYLTYDLQLICILGEGNSYAYFSKLKKEKKNNYYYYNARYMGQTYNKIIIGALGMPALIR